MSDTETRQPRPAAAEQAPAADGHPRRPAPVRPREIGGPHGPEPTRYGDWERNSRRIDF